MEISGGIGSVSRSWSWTVGCPWNLPAMAMLQGIHLSHDRLQEPSGVVKILFNSHKDNLEYMIYSVSSRLFRVALLTFLAPTRCRRSCDVSQRPAVMICQHSRGLPPMSRHTSLRGSVEPSRAPSSDVAGDLAVMSDMFRVCAGLCVKQGSGDLPLQHHWEGVPKCAEP